MEWISVEDRLPENERVLVYIPQRDFLIADCVNGVWWEDQLGYVTGITHWMPLPEPPINLNRGM
jgi:hypothetical protein